MKLTGMPQKLICAALLAFGVSSAVQAESAVVAYISNQNNGVGVLDLSTLELVGSFEVGAKGPRGIGVTADGKYLVTANKDDANISIIDLATRQVVKQVTIAKSGPPPKPGAAAVEDDDDDDKIPARIAIVDIKKGKVLREIISRPETEGMEFSPHGKRMIVTNAGDNTITVHDIRSGKLLKTVSTHEFGDRPRGIKVSPDGKRYVSTLEFGHKLLVLDAKHNPLN